MVSKIEKNNPCKFGNGKEYNKCCMAKDSEGNNNPTYECAFCLKKMMENDIDSTLVISHSIGGAVLQADMHFCSGECYLASEMMRRLIEHEKIGAESIISDFDIFEDWSREDTNTAITKLLSHEGTLIKES